MLKPNETEIKRSIMNYISYIGRCDRIQSGQIRTETSFIKLAKKGTPDILACIDGKFIGVEVKKDQKEIENRYKQNDDRSKGQMMQGKQIQKAGGYYYVVASATQLRDKLIEDNILQ